MLFQASFKNESLILKWQVDSKENLIFNLFYKHENEEIWRKVDLKNVSKNDNLLEYRVECTLPNMRPGRYTCQIQSSCEYGASEMSEKKAFYKEEEVSSVFLFSATQKRIQNPVNYLRRIIL